MPTPVTRADRLARIQQPWDLVVIGGGITGAGIAREATRAGLSALVLEQKDFAWGTSSRSSKLVHGGLRYLAQGEVKLVWESVRERERLMKGAPGLVDSLDFLLANYEGDTMGRWSYAVGLAVYDLLAGCWQHEYHPLTSFRTLAPHLDATNLGGGFRYHDASTDDARLVLRVLAEAEAAGATSLNHVRVEAFLREEGRVVGVRVRDLEGEAEHEVRAKVVVNATGAWVDGLRGQVGGERRMRPLRGSHIAFPAEKLPLGQAIALQHPIDRRMMFVFPWLGVSVVGTTDLDHPEDLDVEPGISPAEVAYLMAAVELRFPELHLGLDDVVSTWCGVRPVVHSGAANPSAETRDHVVWEEQGLITVTGGKLTTFRIIARDALKTVSRQLGRDAVPPATEVLLDELPEGMTLPEDLPEADRRWLTGRYGAAAAALVEAAGPGELDHVEGTPFLWAELRHAARHEWVEHLDDLLLRRTRLGLVAPRGGLDELDHIRAIVQVELGWDDPRWEREAAAYEQLWTRCYSLPERAAIPDWHEMVRKAREAA